MSSPDRMSPMGAVNAVVIAPLSALAVAAVAAFVVFRVSDPQHGRDALNTSCVIVLFSLPAALIHGFAAMLALRRGPRPGRMRLVQGGLLAGASFLTLGALMSPTALIWMLLAMAWQGYDGEPWRNLVMALFLAAGVLAGGAVGGLVLHGVGWEEHS